ncbi:ABC transporter permease [Enterococcus sp. LJL98]
MTSFFQQRVRLHQRRMQRYLKYVFNDHFAFTMTFLLGGLGYYYSGLLKTLPSPYPIGKIIVLLFMLLMLHFGRFASLTQLPDGIFLLPKEKQMRDYLKQALIYSCYVPFGVLLLTTAMAMPFIVIATGGYPFSSVLFFLLLNWSLKFSHLLIQRLAFFQGVERQRKQAYLIWLGISVLIFATSLFASYYLALFFSLLQVVFFYQWLWLKMTAPIDWEKLIQGEQTRLRRVYQFIHLFTDVPEMQGTIKRRKYFDGFLSKIKFEQRNTYLYLFMRHFLRGTEYSGLYFRLTLFGSLLLFFVTDFWFVLGLGSLFIYLIGFQLLPLSEQFRYMTTVQLYPISPSQKQKALQQLLFVLLLVTSLLFAFITLFSLASLSQSLLVLGGYWLVVSGFIWLYLPYRLKK